MVLFRLFKRREKTKLDLFERQSNNVKVWDKDKIEKYYGAGLPKLLAKFADLTKKYPAVKLLIVYREKDERKNWYSPSHNRVVINVALPLDQDSLKFRKTLQESVADYQMINS